MYLIGLTGIAGSGKDTVARLIQLEMAKHGDIMGLYAFASRLKDTCAYIFDKGDEYWNDRTLKESKVDWVFNLKDLKRNFRNDIFDLIDHYLDVKGQGYKPLFDMFWKLHVEREDMRSFLDKLFEVFYSTMGFKEAYSKFDPRRYIFKGKVRIQTTPRKILQLMGTEICRNHIAEDIWTRIAPVNQVIYTDVRFPNEEQHLRDNGGILVKVVNRTQQNFSVMGHDSERMIQELKPDYIIDNNGTQMGPLMDEVESLVEKIYAIH